MTVVISKEDLMTSDLSKDGRCTVCGRGLRPPFLWWRGQTDIVICRKCCCSIKTGFSVDLAIDELQSHYPGFTYVRKATKIVDAAEHEGWERTNNTDYGPAGDDAEQKAAVNDLADLITRCGGKVVASGPCIINNGRAYLSVEDMEELLRRGEG